MIYSHYSEYMAKSMSAGRPGPDPGEYAYLEKYLTTNEEPFLELACGYGRLLLHIMEKGYSIIGTDSSPEMLDQCHKMAEQKGLKPKVYRQFMQKLSLDQTFGFIFIADGTFTLVIEDKDVEELFERVYDHLRPGGTFLFDFYGFFPTEEFMKNNVEKSYTNKNWTKAPDGSIFVSTKISKYDPSTQVTDRLQIHDHYVDGKLVGSQAYEDPNRDHNVPQVIERLRSKGFTDIQLGGYNTDEPPGRDADIYSIRCKKPLASKD